MSASRDAETENLETTPLLRSGAKPQPSKVTKLPSGQLALICCARLVDGFGFFGIFPYIARMIRDSGVPEQDIGFYSGLIESAYSVTTCITLIYVWPDLSDRWGRRPVVLICLVGLSISGTLFGFSRNVWQMVACRAFAGLFSGCIGTLRVVVGEILDETNRAAGYGVWNLGATLGILLAPIAGGLLARPKENINFFRDSALFQTYPYLLPSLLTGSCGIVTVVLCFLYLKETLPPNLTKADLSAIPTQRVILKSAGVKYIMLSCLWAYTMWFAWLALEPVWCFTSVELGGLGLTIQQISSILAALAIIQAFGGLVIFPWMHKRLGNRGTIFYCAICFFMAFALAIASSLLRTTSMHGAFAIVFALSVIAPSLQTVGTVLQMAINDVAPTPLAVSRTNGMALCVTQAGRAFTPPIISSLFAYGIDRRILRGQLAWAVLAVLAVGYGVSLIWYPNEAESKSHRRNPRAWNERREDGGRVS